MEKAPKRILEAWKRVRKEERDGNNYQKTRAAITALQVVVQKLSINMETTRTEPSRLHTYADVVGRGASAPTQHNNTTITKPVPTRHNREIVVVRGAESTQQAQRTGKELVEQLNKEKEGQEGHVIAIRKLQSGDIVITMDDERTRTKWLQQTEWLATFGEGARIKRREFIVLAHGIKVNQIQDQEQAIVRIYEQNPKLKGAIEITRVKWAKPLIRSGRTTGPLHISVLEPEQANTLIKAGLIWDYQLHDCEPYHGDCQITQCFKCYLYGHTAKMCINTTRCGFCAAPGHSTNDCMAKEDRTKYRCVPCGTKNGNHTSWHKDCPMRSKQAQRARLAYSNRPTQFQTHQVVRDNMVASIRAIAQPIGAKQTTRGDIYLTQEQSQRPTQNVNSSTASVRTEGEWQTVQKRTISPAQGPIAKRGRPIGSTRATRNNIDIRTFSNTQT